MEEWPINTILLGYDGSESSQKAAHLAAEVASRRRARVVVLTAFRATSAFRAESMDVVGRRVIDARTQAETMVKELAGWGVPAEADVLEGPAAEAIMTAAASRDVDLIIIGARERNPVAARLGRSTGRRVLRDARKPVLVAR